MVIFHSYVKLPEGNRDVLAFDFFTMDSGCFVPAFAPAEKVCANHQTMEHTMI